MSHEVCVCECVCAHMCVAYTATQGGQTKESGPLGLQLQEVVKSPTEVLGLHPGPLQEQQVRIAAEPSSLQPQCAVLESRRGCMNEHG